MVEKRKDRHGIFLSWIQVVGVLLLLGGVILVWNVYLFHDHLVEMRSYKSLLYGGFVLIGVGVFVLIIGEFQKNL